ncbi:V-type proton ATPase 116 kDa subunit a isoform 1 [Hypsibius exemplaris]|uniref:V-type proton ATPase subunit a n=1 Tax=Hypsibius exemplaris TaxID=2072580 RepID=A0A1W0WXD4_HYPEX|nr:V-type proton ATPase 116 kDa subunit a isoform 1 [Hypsibius exemplaris]
MGSLFRSQEMALCQVFLQSEAAYCCTAELGELGVAQFRDLNRDVNAFQRKFVNEIRRCDDIERILRFLEKQCQKEKVPILRLGENPLTPSPRELADLETTLEKLELEMKEFNTNYEALQRNNMDLLELKHVLRKAQTIFDTGEMGAIQDSASHAELMNSLTSRCGPVASGSPPREASISFMAGTILASKVQAFERLIWRISRGTILVRCSDIETLLQDPHTGEDVRKSIFFAFYQGEQLKSRVKKVCDAFRATVFPCPDQPQDIREMSIQIMTRIEDLKTLLGHTQQHRQQVLTASAKNVDSWTVKVRKIKAVYSLMNCFNIDTTQRCFIGEAWCPTQDLERIRMALLRGSEAAECSVPSFITPLKTNDTPPTYHKTNKFTSGFQAIVDTYGVATYREVNPAPFTVITFPFLFGVMFGDAGHGLVMTMMASVLLWKEKVISKQKDMGEIASTIFGGRYIIFLMGLFSIYTGLIYNDVFSRSLNIFGSRWSAQRSVYNLSEDAANNDTTFVFPTFQLDPTNTSSDYIYDNGPYPFGLDPAWQLATNKINFSNSYKMKMSVILGVIHMLFGICLSTFNHTYFKKKINLICEFVPQVIFLSCMFGYLVVLLFYKWIVFTADKSGCTPGLLIGLINMFLLKHQENPVNKDGTECTIYSFYPHQSTVETILVVVAVLCFPWMLFGKPLYNRWHTKRAHYSEVHNIDEATTTESSTDDGHAGDGFMDVMIYQGIHTIEFCLGVVSNTASYLRLWALSLAHTQLSEVIWSMALARGFAFNSILGVPVLFCIFSFWAIGSLCILILMEGMSAFLHALRLHWVEFQNKFYGGNGYPFEPFDLRQIHEGVMPEPA